MAAYDLVINLLGKNNVTPATAGATKDLNGLKTAAESANGILGKLGVGLSIAGAGALVGKMLGLAAEAEKTAVSFKVLTGSAETAKKVMGDITKFGAETPFELPELATATRKLLAFGVSADQILPTLKMLGDVAAGIDQPIGEIAELFGKAKVQGRLFGEDINQLTGRGIPIIQELAKQFRVSESEVKKLVEQGKVGFPELQKAFESMTGPGGKFAGMMGELSKTAAGQWSTFKDQVNEVLRKLGEEILPYAVEGMKQLSGWLDTNGKSAVAGFTAVVRGMAEALENAYITAMELYDAYLALDEMNTKGSFSIALTPGGREADAKEKEDRLAEIRKQRESVAKGVDTVERGQIGRATSDELDWIEKQARSAEHLELIKKRREELANSGKGMDEPLKKAADASKNLAGGMAAAAKSTEAAAKAIGEMSKATEAWKGKTAVIGLDEKGKAKSDAMSKYFQERDKIKASGLGWEQEREQIAKLQEEYKKLNQAIDDYFAKEGQQKEADKAKDEKAQKSKDLLAKDMEQKTELREKQRTPQAKFGLALDELNHWKERELKRLGQKAASKEISLEDYTAQRKEIYGLYGSEAGRMTGEYAKQIQKPVGQLAPQQSGAMEAGSTEAWSTIMKAMNFGAQATAEKAAEDAAKQTAENTRKMVEALEQIAKDAGAEVQL